LQEYIVWFDHLGMNDVERVGGKNASLGEMIANLSSAGVRVPGGFATTADAFNEFLANDGLADRIHKTLDELDVDDVKKLVETGAEIRSWVMETPFPTALDQALERSPSDWYINAFRGLTFAEVGRFEEAKADMAIVKANWPPDWGPFTAPVATWFWGLYFDSEYRDRLKSAVELAGVPSLPEGYNIKPENRLNRYQLFELVGNGVRSRIKLPTGLTTIDYSADGTRQHYWNGNPVLTSKISINDDGSWRVSTDQWYGQDYVCETFLNPEGSTETFDTHILFCAVGVFYSSFEPL